MTDIERQETIAELESKLINVVADYIVAAKNNQVEEAGALIDQIEEIKQEIKKLGRPD